MSALVEKALKERIVLFGKSQKLLAASIGAAVMLCTAPAMANVLTFQGVTFETVASGNDLRLTITNALTGGTDNWKDINYLNAFEIKGVGNVTGATLYGSNIDVNGWNSNVDNGLAAGAGCTTGGTEGACFYRSSALALTDNMVFDMAFTGTNLNFDAPHLKVQFFESASQTMATGDLLSQTIPEPGSLALMAVAMGVMGWTVHRRNRKQATNASVRFDDKLLLKRANAISWFVTRLRSGPSPTSHISRRP